MKIHDEIDDWSAGALCGALTPEEQQNFERHLAACPRCRSLHEEDRKMNDIMKQSMVEVRPDPNFERRIIDGFRGKISHGWFHPLRGLVWLVQFRTVQAALALLLVAAMVKGGSMISGEGFPGEKASNAYSAQANTRVLADKAANLVEMEIRTASPALNPNYTAQVFSGKATWNGFSGGNNTNWITATNWGDTNAANLGGQGAPVVNGGLSIGDTTANTLTINASGTNANTSLGSNFAINSLNFTGADAAVTTGSAATISGNVALGSNQTWALNAAASSPLTVSGTLSGNHALAMAGPGALTLTGANTYTGATTVTAGTALAQRSASGASSDIIGTLLQLQGAGNIAGAVTKEGSGTEVFSGSNSYSDATTLGATTITSGTFQLGANKASGYFGGTPNNNTVTNFSGNVVSTGSSLGNQTYGAINQTSGTLDNLKNRVVAAGSSNFGSHGGTVASGTQGQDLYDNGRIDSINEMESKTGGPMGPKTLENPTSRAAQNPNQSGGAKPVQVPQLAPLPIIDTRKLVRTATLDFEVANFDKALQIISGVASEEQGYIFTQNSGKAPDGKLEGQIVVKVAPANLDRFLLRVRDIGEIKNETVSAQDVSKDYYDTESRMRNAEITEERMIDILKKRTGDVADLMEVEKQIAEVRGEVEQMQGQLKYYDGLVQFATVTITLAEKGDVNQNAAWLLTQQAQLSLFSKDVEQSFTDAKNDATAANAQTLESHMERDVDGREIATLHLLLPPENADVAIAKLKAIGRIQTFTTQTQRVPRNNGGSDQNKVERDKVELNLVIQHDVEDAVQGTNISVQAEDVEEKTTQIKQEAAAAGVEVKGADFNRARNGAEVSSMLLRMPIKKYPAFLEQIKMLGKVKDLTVGRRENANATEDAPAEIILQIFNQAANPPPVVPVPAPKITVHSTIGEGMQALMWSLRMIGVTLAFFAPWVVVTGLAAGAWLVLRRRRMARKQG